jgi:hypothetical protein
MNHPTIHFDTQTGRLVHGLVWVLDPRTMDDVVHGETSSYRRHEMKRCPDHPEHITGIEFDEIVIDLVGGDILDDFVPIWDMSFHLVSADYAKKLAGSSLKGYSIRPLVKVACNQTKLADPELYCLQNEGRGTGVVSSLARAGRAESMPTLPRGADGMLWLR